MDGEKEVGDRKKHTNIYVAIYHCYYYIAIQISRD